MATKADLTPDFQTLSLFEVKPKAYFLHEFPLKDETPKKTYNLHLTQANKIALNEQKFTQKFTLSKPVLPAYDKSYKKESH